MEFDWASLRLPEYTQTPRRTHEEPLRKITFRFAAAMGAFVCKRH